MRKQSLDLQPDIFGDVPAHADMPPLAPSIDAPEVPTVDKAWDSLPVGDAVDNLPEVHTEAPAVEPLAVELASTPPELKAIPRWVCWKYVDGRKIPFNARSRARASSTDPQTWSDYAQAVATYQAGGFAGIGIVLDGSNRLAGVDIDGCVIDGVPSPEALALLASLDARYIEVSPSGKGLRAFGYADPLTAGANGQIGGLKTEFYTQGRYLTLTGHALQTGPLSELVGFADKAQQAREGKKAAREASKPAPVAHAPVAQQVASKATDRRVQAYASAALDNAAQAVATAPEGQRNDTLNSEALSLFRLPVVDPSTAWEALGNAAVGNGLNPGEVVATLASARNAAANMPPREIPPSKVAATFPPLTGTINAAPEEDDDTDNHRNAPRPSLDCLYGLVGEVAHAGSEATEANPFAIAANFIAYLSCAVGRGPYTPVGNTWHHARHFTLHVGRSGRGRKGDAIALVRRIDMAVRGISKDLAPQVHAGGLSSREGLVCLIHDGYKDGKDEVPPMLDKRLWVIESEFANILHQSKRDGNTLSAALRDCWDGISLKPATKTNRLWATDPHICLSGAVTPSELLGLMASRELSNGFANRFLVFWAERTKMLAFPEATPQHEVQALARKVAEVLQFAGADRWADKDAMHVTLSPQARQRYEYLYHTELNDNSAGERITALIERRAPMLRRLAMLFALCDKTSTVEVPHIDAALAWVRYSVDSVKFIFGSAQAEIETAETNGIAQTILEFLAEQKRATRSQLTTDCFKGHTPKARIDAALDELLTCNPPQIEVHEDRSKKGRPAKFYELSAKYAKEAKKVHSPNGAADFSLCEESEESAKEVPVIPSSPPPEDFLRNTSQYFAPPKNEVLPSVAGLSSHSSHTSQAFSKKVTPPNAGDDDVIEVAF